MLKKNTNLDKILLLINHHGLDKNFYLVKREDSFLEVYRYGLSGLPRKKFYEPELLGAIGRGSLDNLNKKFKLFVQETNNPIQSEIKSYQHSFIDLAVAHVKLAKEHFPEDKYQYYQSCSNGKHFIFIGLNENHIISLPYLNHAHNLYDVITRSELKPISKVMFKGKVAEPISNSLVFRGPKSNPSTSIKAQNSIDECSEIDKPNIVKPLKSI